jgi:hypothetical protein
MKVTYRQKDERQKAEEKQSAFTVTLQLFEEACLISKDLTQEN